ncbi:Glycosyltransferase involved in cell wall bisynthesis [Bradyrhizobium lablabi]|uniref:Glycosyltransferase involved in cell wall bisynthesis n=1 Tax=Bradyrhizobium lablabi TaxID=722472 RepID=A0A1M6MP02_9BRAD|nr:glycosyltransferase [Bradyrhizobium lablabi]SHJ85013.1 Glycosyltransferase involved in cell wall bisynthesis [Bradyrhizobium lablabi]
MDRLVSIYLPTHNRRQLLERAVDSVLSQTYRNIELIVVNDGSTDDTSLFLNKISQSDRRLVAIDNPRSLGPSPSRNLAVKAAKGFFISGLDDDDEFTPDRIAQFVDYWNVLAAGSSPPVCLFSQSVFVSGGNRIVTRDRKDHVQFEDLFHHNYIGNQVFCIRDNLISAGLFDEHLNAWEDLDLFMRLLRQFGEARLLDAPTYICDVSINRDRISRNEPRIRRAFDIISAKYNELPPAAHQGLYLQMFSDYHGIRPTIADFRRFLGWGFDSSGLKQLLKSSIKGLALASA